MRKFLFLLFCIISFFELYSQNKACFNVASSYANSYVGDYPSYTIPADFNNDNIPDLAVLDDGSLKILLGNGQGFFDGATKNNYPYFGNYASMDTADFNNDNILDVAVGWANRLTIMLGKNTSGMDSSNIVFTKFIETITSGDVNKDGKADLLLSFTYDSSITVMLGNGVGNFSPPVKYRTSKWPKVIKIADLNNDGKNDLVYIADSLAVIMGDSLGSFGPETKFNSIYNNANLTDIAIGDFNSDNNMDVATVASFANGGGVYLGNGTGGLNLSSTFFGGNSPNSVRIYDLNADGLSDVLITNSFDGTLMIHYGNGLGSFSTFKKISYYPSSTPFNGTNPVCAVASDLNLDGLPDLIAIDQGSYSQAIDGGIYVLINRGSQNYLLSQIPNLANCSGIPLISTSADFDGDGYLDFAGGNCNDSAFISFNDEHGAFGIRHMYYAPHISSSIINGDFNHDGATDLCFSRSIDSSIALLLNNGAGVFGSELIAIHHRPLHYIVANDLNSDDNTDLIMFNTDSLISIYMCNGNGTFGVEKINSVGSFNCEWMAFGDINNDGFKDVIVSGKKYISSSNNYYISIMLNDGQGNLTNLSTISNGSCSISNLNLSDYNEDGKLDLSWIDCSNNYRRKLGIGNGAFGSITPPTFLSAAPAIQFFVNDFNFDKHLDILTVNTTGINIFFGTGTGSFSLADNHSITTQILNCADYNNDSLPDLLLYDNYLNNRFVAVNETSIIDYVSNNFCNTGNAVQLHSTKGGEAYNWEPGNSTSTTLIVNTSGVYSLTVISESESCSTSVSKNIQINSSVSISGNQQVCQGNSSVLTATGANTYTWSNNVYSAIDTIYPTINTTYTIIGTDLSNCNDTIIYSVTVMPLPSVSYTLAPDATPHTWDAYPTYGSNVASATWYWGDGTNTIGLYPSHTYSTPANYNVCVSVIDTAGCTSIYCLNDSLYRTNATNTIVQINIVNGTLDISKISNQNSQIKIYPNPTNSILQVSVSNEVLGQIKIVDVLGNEILQTQQKQIDVSNLANGVYFVRVGASTQKFVVQH